MVNQATGETEVIGRISSESEVELKNVETFSPLVSDDVRNQIASHAVECVYRLLDDAMRTEDPVLKHGVRAFVEEMSLEQARAYACSRVQQELKL